jgi:hypothetical protein
MWDLAAEFALVLSMEALDCLNYSFDRKLPESLCSPLGESLKKLGEKLLA